MRGPGARYNSRSAGTLRGELLRPAPLLPLPPVEEIVMNRQIVWSLLLLFCTAPLMAQEEIQPPAAKPVDKKDYSYAIGANIGRSMKADGIDIDIDELVKGLTASISGSKLRLSDEQLRTAMTGLQRDLQAKAMKAAEAASAKNKAEGAAYLAANKKKEGVVTLESGLQYKVLKAGKGASPKATDTVKTHYHGTLIDGKVFDSSVEREEPVSFPVNRVIPGWTEALQKMKVGDKWQLVIPSELAYGERGTPDGSIGPHSVLVFEVELLEIEK
jgi:FKBP-type peptidyl-prolyl cis-trans isomerase FklB